MGLGGRSAKARHQQGRTAGVVSSEYWTFAPGDRVKTVEGLPGVVTEVQDGPYPGSESYIVALDDGLGGGEYSPSELAPIGGARTAMRSAWKGNLPCPNCQRTMVGEDGEGGLCTDCTSMDAEASVEPHTAAEDYPELGGILIERPPLQHAVKASLEKQAASGEWHNSDGYSEDATSPQLTDHLLTQHPNLILSDDDTQLLADHAAVAWDPYDRDALDEIHYQDHNRNGECGAHELQAEAGCSACAGTGEQSNGHECYICDGSGTASAEAESRALGVTNANPENDLPVGIDLAREAGFFTDHVVYPWAKNLNEHLNPGFKYDPATGGGFSYDWCRFRKNRRCMYPKTLDAVGTKQAGYPVWTPVDRGLCPRDKWVEQEHCPLGEPGPHSGDPHALPDATISWEQGGQRQAMLREAAYLTKDGTPLTDADKLEIARQAGWEDRIAAAGTSSVLSMQKLLHQIDIELLYPMWARNELDMKSVPFVPDPDSYGEFDPEAHAYFARTPVTAMLRQAQLLEMDPADMNAGQREVARLVEEGDIEFVGLAVKAVDSGRVLLAQRTPFEGDDEEVYGRWEFPGGHIEDGEDPLDAALREFSEETGLELPDTQRVVGGLKNGKYLLVVVHVPSEAWTVNAKLLDFEVMGLGWFHPDQVEDTDLIRKEMADTEWDLIREASRDSLVTQDPEFRFHFTSSWNDVRAKAKRIRAEGKVRIIAAPNGGKTFVTAEVEGDHNLYQATVIHQPGRRAVAMWECGCAWASYSWGRSGRWKKYEGRMCSHALATLFEAQAQGMFGRDVKEQTQTPPWRMDTTIPVLQPTNYPKPKRAASLGSDMAPEPIIEHARALLESGEDPNQVMAVLRSFGVRDVSIVMTAALRGGPFKAKVMADVETVIDILTNNWVRLADGLVVPDTEVYYPTYDPRLGLSLSDSIPHISALDATAVDYRGPQIETIEGIADDNRAIYSTGNPPPGTDLVRQFAVTPVGADFFADEADDLSRAYRDLPILDPTVAPLWQKLGEVVTAQAEALRAQYDIQVFDDVDPYETAEQMHADINSGVYKVTTLHSHHPVWDVPTNVNFRIAHDILGHGRANSDFSFKGEVEAYQAQCNDTPEDLWPVLFSEVIAQAAYANTHHLFGEQKVALVPLTQAQITTDVGKIMDAPDPTYDAMHYSAYLRNRSFPGHQEALSLSDRKTRLKVSDCKYCGHAIAWAKSKAGKSYPCEVQPKEDMEYGQNHDVLRAKPWEPHRCQKQSVLVEAFDSSEKRDPSGKWTDFGKSISPNHQVPSGNRPDNPHATEFSKLPKEWQDKITKTVADNSPDTDYQGKLTPERMVQNLELLYHHAKKDDPDSIKQGKTWYDDANGLAQQVAKEGNITGRQATGIIASLSPNAHWEENKTLSHFVGEKIREDRPLDFDPKVLAAVNKMGKKQGIHLENGKKISELDPLSAAYAIYARGKYQDDLHIPGRLKLNGDPYKAMWTTGMKNIAKAVSMYRGTDPDEVLSGHKTRSFFNNIADPHDQSKRGDVTMDVHALSAASHAEMSAQSDIVGKLFDTGSSTALNAHGAYAMYADAYRNALTELKAKGEIPKDTTPAQFQAMIWLHWRHLTDKLDKHPNLHIIPRFVSGLITYAAPEHIEPIDPWHVPEGEHPDPDHDFDDVRDPLPHGWPYHDPNAEDWDDEDDGPEEPEPKKAVLESDWAPHPEFGQAADGWADGNVVWADQAGHVHGGYADEMLFEGGPTDYDAMASGLGYDDGTEFAEDHPEYAEAELHDEPEAALPETDGSSEDDDEQELASGLMPNPLASLQQGLGWLTADLPAERPVLASVSVPRAPANPETATSGDIAAAAREFLAKDAMKAFSPAEQREIIEEGRDVIASNLDRLDIAGTHYETLEAALAAQDDMEDDESWMGL